MTSNNLTGLFIGLITFLIIGLFHPLVIKSEYHIGVKSWILFFIAGIGSAVASVLVKHMILSIILGVIAFSSFWSILEVFQQKKRVEKGWFRLIRKKAVNLLRQPLRDYCKIMCNESKRPKRLDLYLVAHKHPPHKPN